jgi:dihydrodipicolinate synthase/N-acetylneuraminate lyase
MNREDFMHEMRPPRGLIVDLITPLDHEGGIDRGDLQRLLKRVLPHADGVLLASPLIGEGRALGLEGKLELLEHAMAVIGKETPILFWITEESSEGTKKALSVLEDLVDSSDYRGGVFWLDTPLYYHSNRGLYGHYTELVSMARKPFVLYNDPGLIGLLDRPLKRVNIRTSIVTKLGGIEGIKGLIFRGSLARANHYQKALSRRPDFKVYDGDETRFLEHPSMSGIVSMGANIAPGIWDTITRASLGIRSKEDDPGQLLELATLLRELLRIYRKNPVRIIKKALFDLRVIGSPACTPITEPLEDDTNPLTGFISEHKIQ